MYGLEIAAHCDSRLLCTICKYSYLLIFTCIPAGGATGDYVHSNLKPIHSAAPDTTKLSCLCRVRFGGVNWIPDNSRLSHTENVKSEHVQNNRPIHIGRPDATQTVSIVLSGGVNGVGPIARQVRSASQALPVRPPDALRRRTHWSGAWADSIHTA